MFRTLLSDAVTGVGVVFDVLLVFGRRRGTTLYTLICLDRLFVPFILYFFNRDEETVGRTDDYKTNGVPD